MYRGCHTAGPVATQVPSVPGESDAPGFEHGCRRQPRDTQVNANELMTKFCALASFLIPFMTEIN